MKRHLRKNDKPLQQFIKRMADEFCTQQNFYLRPVPSSVLSEFFVSNLSPILQAWSVQHIKHKCVKLPSSYGNMDSFVVFPLIK